MIGVDDFIGFISHFATTEQEKKWVAGIKAAASGLRDQDGPEYKTESDSHHNTARDKYNGKAEHAEKLPIGQEIFDKGNQVLDFIKKIDPQNTSGAVQPAVDIMKKLLDNTDPMKALKGMTGGDLYGMLNQIMSMINKAGSKGGGNNGGVQTGSPCLLIDNTPGTLQYVNTSILICVNSTGGVGVAPGTIGTVTVTTSNTAAGS